MEAISLLVAIIGIAIGMGQLLVGFLQLRRTPKHPAPGQSPPPQQTQPPPPAAKSRRSPGRRFLGALTMFLGSALLIVYYIAPQAPLIEELSNMNLLIGGGLILLGVVVVGSARRET